MPYIKSAVVGGFLALEAAVISVLTTLNIVHWSATQTTLVSTTAAAAITFLGAIVAHLWPGTKQETVALAATFTALVASILSLGTGFQWWHLTAEQVASLVSVVTAFIGISSALVARQFVTAKTTSVAQ
jgi:hypothetical protein